MLGVGVLAAVQTAQSGSWLTRGLLDLWSQSAERPHDLDVLEPRHAHHWGENAATLAPVERYDWIAELPDAAPPRARGMDLRSLESLADRAVAAVEIAELHENRARTAAERAEIEAAAHAWVFAQHGRQP